MLMKRISAGVAVVLMLTGGVAWAENEATFNSSTGVVNIPKVYVGTGYDYYYYNVDMAQQGTGLDFLVTAIAPATSTSADNVATYNVNNRSLHIPLVIVGADRYSVDLAQLGEGYNFSVTSATLSKSLMVTGLVPDTGQTTSYSEIFGEDHDYTINPPSYSANGNGTVNDNVTGLMWQQQDDGVARTWDAAITYCNNLVLASNSDWRLPTTQELLGIVDFGLAHPAISSSPFTSVKIDYYWSSSTVAGTNDTASSVNFDTGKNTREGKVNVHYVRCVSGGQ
jgi:hypothetical protein